ncbi:hypothetical protein KP509_03G043000 [Ceratopteris richardii]|nr:hypothetical protein KP509_03G043000 [Ceratopteris richardii]
MVDPQVHSWDALIVAYVKHHEPKHALSLYLQMHRNRNNSICLSDYAVVALLKACASLKDVQTGYVLHMKAVHVGLLESNTYVGCSMIDMYAKCGFISTAHEVFKSLATQDTVCWNALLAGFSEQGCSKEALETFVKMQQTGVPGDVVTYLCGLKACGNRGNISMGKQIHAEVVRKGLESDLTICNILVDMYARCGLLLTAMAVFQKLPSPEIVSANTLLGGLLEGGRFREALAFFQGMQENGMVSTMITYIFILKACSGGGALAKGQEIHAEIVTQGLEREQQVGSSLIDMYSKCGLLFDAHSVLQKSANRSIASWSALIAGYIEFGHGKEALDCFWHMKREGISPDAFAFSCALKACGSMKAATGGEGLHAEIIKKGLEKEALVGNTLVSMYANLGFLSTAQHLFDMLSACDMVALNALIICYYEKGCAEQVIRCFGQMHIKGIPLNLITVIFCLKACCSTGSIMKGKEIHGMAVQAGLEQDNYVGNALVDLYVKFLLLSEAQQVFDGLQERDIISWTSLMGGYSMLGESNNVFFMFECMKEEGIKPNSTTFVHVLNVCNHTGLVKESQVYFEAMREEYSVTPELDHYTCIIDLLARVGNLEKTFTMIMKIPVIPDLVLWHIILAACRKWNNVELGQFAFEHAIKLNEQAAATYTYMFDIYTAVGMHESARRIEKLRMENQT